MTVINSQAVAGATQGGYAPQPVQTEYAQVAAPEANQSVKESSKPAKDFKEGKESEKEASEEAIKKAVADINKHANGTEAVFGIHDKTNRITIKIVDKESKEVIKEVPAEKTLDLIAKAWELAGLMVDEKR